MLNSSKNSSKDNSFSFNYNNNGSKNNKYDFNHNKTVLKITNLVIYFLTVKKFKILFAIQLNFGMLVYRTKGFSTAIEIFEFFELTKNKL
ncbi:hypothetical protein CN671_25585 [Bacillus toyonensis]|nr:hypothetical protein CN671_25585 [Bacillus toyonensis]PFZ65211.1 hypothetical protein COL72_31190 [Bacillus toyonensis]